MFGTELSPRWKVKYLILERFHFWPECHFSLLKKRASFQRRLNCLPAMAHNQPLPSGTKAKNTFHDGASCDHSVSSRQRCVLKNSKREKMSGRTEKHYGHSEKTKTLDLNIPKDARAFILEALPQALPNGAKATHAHLADGRTISLKTLSDSEAVQYAWELLPIYQAKFPELCRIDYEH